MRDVVPSATRLGLGKESGLLLGSATYRDVRQSTGDFSESAVTSRPVNRRCVDITTVCNLTLVLRAANLRGLYKFINNKTKRIVAPGHSTIKLCCCNSALISGNNPNHLLRRLLFPGSHNNSKGISVCITIDCIYFCLKWLIPTRMVIIANQTTKIA